MSNVDRRQFLKLVGAGGVGAGAGFMLAESIKHPVEYLIPYPIPPEEFSPGIATWYNSVCGMCPAGCGISVRTREGRAKKIEGNPLHPVNQGRLCALGQAGLQTLYNPDRLTGPMLQSGERGSEEFIQTTWEESLATVAHRLAAARDGGKNIYLLSEGVRGHLAMLLERFMDGLGSEHLMHYDFAHPHALYAANQRLFGEHTLPYYDIRNTRYLLSFGADYLSNWLSPVHHSLGFGHSRQGTDLDRGRFVQIEAKMSLSGAAADEWIPARPGSEGILALGLAHQILAGGAYTGSDFDDWNAALAGYSAESVAERTGVAAKTIVRLASEFMKAEPGLAIGGGAVDNHSNAVDTLVAVNLLNYLVGNIGKPGGIVFNSDPVVGGPANNRQANFIAMQQLAEQARHGAIDVLIVNNTNPVFTLPHASGFREALASIPMIVSLSSFMDETTTMADVVLPSHSYLESWGDDMPQPGLGFPVAAISQPVVSPLYNTRATGDIILDLAGKLGMKDSMPWDSMEACLKDGWRQIYERSSPDASDFDTFWRDVLVSGVWGEDIHRQDTVVVDKSVIDNIDVAEPEFSGDSEQYPFFLHPYMSTAMYDGRGANLPWMQELPDPMTSIVYGSWVEMNPATAQQLGLRDGDLVSISSEYGSLEAPVVIFPAIMPEVIAMPIGQGHSAFGRYARDRGTNPLQILAPLTATTSGSLATHATRVSLAATGRRAAPVQTGGDTRQLGRNIVQFTGDDSSAGGHSANLNSIPIVVKTT
ncbi:MAG: molybdopterin-dependent oxidoreductase [Proteobacteria bacterium]|nr:molybdopterin-dependent oxidoreductase [Pseudomonadota bacterium]